MSDFAVETFPWFAAIEVFAFINLTLSAVSDLNTVLMLCVPEILMLLLGIELGAHFSRRRPFISFLTFLMWFLDQTLGRRRPHVQLDDTPDADSIDPPFSSQTNAASRSPEWRRGARICERLHDNHVRHSQRDLRSGLDDRAMERRGAACLPRDPPSPPQRRDEPADLPGGGPQIRGDHLERDPLAPHRLEGELSPLFSDSDSRKSRR